MYKILNYPPHLHYVYYMLGFVTMLNCHVVTKQSISLKFVVVLKLVYFLFQKISTDLWHSNETFVEKEQIV